MSATKMVYTMVCRRVGHATCLSSPCVSLRYCKKLIVVFFLIKNPSRGLMQYYSFTGRCQTSLPAKRSERDVPLAVSSKMRNRHQCWVRLASEFSSGAGGRSQTCASRRQRVVRWHFQQLSPSLLDGCGTSPLTAQCGLKPWITPTMARSVSTVVSTSTRDLRIVSSLSFPFYL